MASGVKKVSGWKLWLLVILCGIADLIQAIIAFTGVGLPVSEAIEFGMPIGIIAYCRLSKIPLFTNFRRLISILGSFGVGAITGGIAPLWVLDAWYLKYDVQSEEKRAEEEAEQQEILKNFQLPKYVEGEDGDGIRPPDGYTPAADSMVNESEYSDLAGRMDSAKPKISASKPRYSGGIGSPTGK